ncbi:uncharacterized protein METZ01_LOCUS181477, partial [marine metagenome]
VKRIPDFSKKTKPQNVLTWVNDIDDPDLIGLGVFVGYCPWDVYTVPWNYRMIID